MLFFKIDCNMKTIILGVELVHISSMSHTDRNVFIGCVWLMWHKHRPNHRAIFILLWIFSVLGPNIYQKSLSVIKLILVRYFIFIILQNLQKKSIDSVIKNLNVDIWNIKQCSMFKMHELKLHLYVTSYCIHILLI